MPSSSTKTYSPWTEHEGDFATEMSDLQGNNGIVHRNVRSHDGMRHIGLVVLPTGEEIPWSSWVAKYDTDDEITHWEHKRQGITFTIFND